MADTDKMKEYEVSCKIEGRLHVTLKANNLKEAAKKATEAFYDADFGELHDPDMDFVHIIDDDGKYNYPPFN